jgi:TRAP-type uncharacterized transport system fused permease subunit
MRYDIGGSSPEKGALIALLKRPELYLFAVPVACLITFMISGYSTTRSVTYALLSTLVTSLFVPGRRLTPRRILNVLDRSGMESITLTAASACVGIVIGLTLMTALGARLTSIIVDFSAGSIVLGLAMVMVASIILGMGLPTSVCYILLATLAAPALVKLGIPPLAAHLFILYFGMMSMVTPPDAMAAYAGAAIAGADMMKTGMTASYFSLSAYFLPFMFALNPAFLMIGTTSDILMATVRGVVGVMTLSAVVTGHLKTPLQVRQRLALFIAAVALIYPGLLTDVIGVALWGMVLMSQFARKEVRAL